MHIAAVNDVFVSGAKDKMLLCTSATHADDDDDDDDGDETCLTRHYLSLLALGTRPHCIVCPPVLSCTVFPFWR